MSIETEPGTAHGGRLFAHRLRAHCVTKLFTLSGGHLFSLYDGCREEGIDIVDVRHEQAAAFAAEGWAKVTRRPGVAALTAGPGVTNGMSALASAQADQSPMLVLGGRAPALGWGMGSLQGDRSHPVRASARPLRHHRPVGRRAAGPVDEALAAAQAPPSGPAFVDLPLDHVFAQGTLSDAELDPPERGAGAAPDTAQTERAMALLSEAERPSCASPSSSTAWRVDASPPTTSCSSPARAPRG